MHARLQPVGCEASKARLCPTPVSYTHLDVYKRQEYALMVDVARRATEPPEYAEKLGSGIAKYAGQQADGEYGPDPY